MGRQKGFTLIELLVVIAIIAILVAIVLVAIDPVQRLRDAQDRTAASNVRSSGTLLSTCITQALVNKSAKPYTDCDEKTTELASYGNVPSNVTVENNPAADDLCAVQQGSVGSPGHYYVYKSSTGAVKEEDGNVPMVSLWCP